MDILEFPHGTNFPYPRWKNRVTDMIVFIIWENI